jgi:oligosaccharide repeat unit polymerase
MITFFCFIICAGIVLSTVRQGADILSPARVFGFVWSLAIGLAELKLSALQHEWSTTGWILVLMGPVAFLLGTFVAYVGNVNTTLVPVSDMRSNMRVQYLNADRLFIAICIGLGIYFFSYLVTFLVKGFIPLFSVKGAVLRTQWGVFGFGILVHSMPFVLFFTALYHIAVQGRSREKLILKVLCSIMVVTFVFLLQRFQLVFSVVICFTLIYYMTRLVRFRMVVVPLAALVTIFYLVSTLRAGVLLQWYLHAMSKMRFSKEYALFTEPYMYLVMNLENLARAVERLETFTFGYYSFDFLFALSGIKHWIKEYFQLNPTPFLVSSYNTYTAFWTYYQDFGVIGIAGIPFLLGLGIASTYYWMRSKPTVRKLAAYSLMVFVMLLSFFSIPIGLLWFVYNAVAIYLILRVISEPRQGFVAGRMPERSRQA